MTTVYESLFLFVQTIFLAVGYVDNFEVKTTWFETVVNCGKIEDV